MLPSLLQIDTSAGAIKRHFALLATTLRANASVNRGTKAFLFSFFAGRTTHEWALLKSLSHAKSIVWLGPASWSKHGQSCSGGSSGNMNRGKTMFLWAFEVPK
jgi:hypothetical protein